MARIAAPGRVEAGDQKAGVWPGSEDDGWVEWLVESGAAR